MALRCQATAAPGRRRRRLRGGRSPELLALLAALPAALLALAWRPSGERLAHARRALVAAPGEAQGPPDLLAALRPWFEARGGYDAGLLEVREGASGARGLHARRAIREGEVLLAASPDVWLSAENLLPPALQASTVNESWDLRLTAGLALLLAGAGAAAVRCQDWGPYLQSCLPSRAELGGALPLFWSADRLAQETWAGPGLVRVVAQRRARLTPLLEGGVWKGLEESVSFDDLAYAYGLLTSRSIGFGEWAPEEAAIVPLVDLVNHAPASGEAVPSANCRFATMASKQIRPVDERLLVLLEPSSERVNAVCRAGGMGIVADRPLAAGEEALVEYGDYNDARLFVEYGFRCRNNPYGAGTFEEQALNADA